MNYAYRFQPENTIRSLKCLKIPLIRLKPKIWNPNLASSAATYLSLSPSPNLASLASGKFSFDAGVDTTLSPSHLPDGFKQWAKTPLDQDAAWASTHTEREKKRRNSSEVWSYDWKTPRLFIGWVI